VDSSPLIVELEALLLPSDSGLGRFVQLLQRRGIGEGATASFRNDVLAYLTEQHAKGRPLLLGIFGDREEAAAVAARLDIFDDVIQLEPNAHWASHGNASVPESVMENGSFDFVGSRSVDSPIWLKARSAIVVGDEKVEADLRSRGVRVERAFASSKPHLRDWLSALRIHQWTKNLLIFVPLIASHQIFDFNKLTSAAIAFIAFSLCVSATYMWNDIADLETDRQHPTKRNRAFASGRISITAGARVSLGLLATGLLISVATLPAAATLAILGYIAATLLYSALLKRQLVVDVVTLTLLLSLRVFIGGIVTSVEISPWLFAFSTFFFLSLAFVKRFVDLSRMPPGQHQELGGRGYIAQDIGLVSSMGSSSGLISVLILALYITSPGVVELYSTPEILWFMCPALLYWIARVWFLAHRGEMADDPVSFALTDTVSQWVAVLALISVVAASLI
jgi:4-hydroxybenzoate polyprenyltransferase